MNSEFIDGFSTTYSGYFSPDKLKYLSDKMKNQKVEKMIKVCNCGLKKPSEVLFVSVFLGIFGVDRFLIGDVGMGVLKLLTLGGCGLLSVADWFMIAERVREKNFKAVMEYL